MNRSVISSLLVLAALCLSAGVQGFAAPPAINDVWMMSPQICVGKPHSSTAKAAGWRFVAESRVCRATSGDRPMVASVYPTERGRFIVQVTLQLEKGSKIKLFLDEIAFDLGDGGETISVAGGPDFLRFRAKRSESQPWSKLRIERQQETLIVTLNDKEVIRFCDKGRFYEKVGLDPVAGSTDVKNFSLTGQLARATQEIVNSVGMKLRRIPAGEFMMGSAKSPQEFVRMYDLVEEGAKNFAVEHPQHKVRITRPFYLGVTEVTQGQWKSVMGTEPWSGEEDVKVGPDYAANYVDWEDATEFCKTLSAKEGETYRLPTEAEWEYACRAGTTSLYPFGDDESRLWKYAEFYREVGERFSLRVGQKKPNPWGLKGMHGNAFEWCHDWYGEDYYEVSPERDPRGPTEGTTRVCRGGGWAYLSGSYRPAQRGDFEPDVAWGRIGFRVARDLSSE